MILHQLFYFVQSFRIVAEYHDYNQRMRSLLCLRKKVTFSQINSYLERFSKLESDVARLQREVISKKEQIERLQQLNLESGQDKVQKFLSTFLNKSFETKAITEEREKLKQMYKKLEAISEEGADRLRISNKLIAEEKANREKIFLGDLALFNEQYHSLSKKTGLGDEVLLGLELSAKSLEKILEKEGVEWIGTVDEKYSPDIHEAVDGKGSIVAQVRQKGVRVKSNLHSKAKVVVKRD